MMGEYVKPIVLENEELAEGVYMASGDDCYKVKADMHQILEEGRINYRIQVNAAHNADHHATMQLLTLSFNQPVTYISTENGKLNSGDGTSTLEIQYNYHSNNTDNIGMGAVTVESGSGLAITDAVMSCNKTCDQH